MTHEYTAETFHDAYRFMLDDVVEYGEKVNPRGQGTSELRDVVLLLPHDRDGGKAWGRTNDRYVLAEMAWYLSRDPSAAFIKQHAALWGRIENPDGTVNSNYGEKLWAPREISNLGLHYPPLTDKSEWQWCRDSLVADMSTRQAVAVIHRPEHHWPGNKDVPCTLTMSWMIRDGRLESRFHMRSSDAWFGLPYDVPFFTWLGDRMLYELRKAGVDVKPGQMRLALDSFHLYDHRAKHARDYLARWKPAPRWLNPVPPFGDLDALSQLCKELLAEMAPEAEA